MNVMKKIYLLMFAAALAMGASAQRLNSAPVQVKGAPQIKVKSMSEAHVEAQSKVSVRPALKQSSSVKKEMQMLAPGAVAPAPRKAMTSAPYYRRPAGAYFGAKVIDNGVYVGEFDQPFLSVKPFREYTFESWFNSSSAIRMWDAQLWGTNPETGENEQLWYGTPEGEDCPEITLMYGWEYDESPILYVNSFSNYYRLQNNTSSNSNPGAVLSCAYMMDMLGYEDLLLSSKTMPAGGRNGDQPTLFEHLTGAPAATGQSSGYWFGKNGSVTKSSSTYALNGIGQAFERPSAPYLMKQVVLYAADLQVTGSVTMNCKVYRLKDGIPAYKTSGRATLPDQPGEVIATGRATINANTNATTGGMIIFNLYDAQGRQIFPEIDDAILVAVEGFNDASMSKLANFSAYISADYNVDEGYGELAYIRYADKDNRGNIGEYEWRGLNNFFALGEMMTGYSLYITTDNPFICFDYYEVEDGAYTFGKEGGVMIKVYDATHVTRSIQFCSTNPGSDWTLTNADGGDMPDWLDFELIDTFDGTSSTGVVTAVVTADPLPRGTRYREATVCFAIPGDYIYYTFIQQDDSPVVVLRGDVNDNGTVNAADISALIDYLLGNSGGDSVNVDNADCDLDGDVTPSDISALIDYLLNSVWSE